RDDHPHLLRGDLQREARRVADACLTFEEWADRAELPLVAGSRQMLAHAHCHQKALVGPGPMLRALEHVAKGQVVDLDAGCCGMAGSIGYEREHYELSRAIGERKLLPAVREASPDAIVAASGFSCRHQIHHFTRKKAVHPAALLHSMLVDRNPAP